MRLIRASLLVLLAGCGTSTDAQNIPLTSGQASAGASSLQERTAARVASEEILRSVFGTLRTAGREELRLPDLPLETRLALTVSWNSSDDLIQSFIPLIDRDLDGVSRRSKMQEDVDLFIQVSGRYATDESEVRQSEIQNEIGYNRLVTPERAAHAIRAEQAILAKVGPKLKALQTSLTSSIRDRLVSRPDLLKPFANQKPASDELSRSRAAVRAVLDETRRKPGR